MPSSPANVRCVVFDATGTVIRPEPSVADAYHHVARRFDSALTADEIDARFRSSFARHFGAGLEQTSDGAGDPSSGASDQDDRDRWFRVVTEVIDDVADQHHIAMFEQLWEHFARPAGWQVYEDVEPAFRQLKQAGLELAVGSNFDSRIRTIVAGHAEMQWTDRCFWSTQLRAAKPSLKFYHRIAERLELAPDQLLMVGDDRVNDVEAARAAGWHALLIDRQAEAGEEVISDLRQIADWLRFS